MLKWFGLLYFFLIGDCFVYAQLTAPTFFPRSIESNSYYSIDSDTTYWKREIIDSVSRRLGSIPFEGKFKGFYAFDLGVLGTPAGIMFHPFYQKLTFSGRASYWYHDSLTLNVSEQDTLYLFGIQTLGEGLSTKAKRNLSKMVFSAVLQEIDSTYNTNPGNFMEIKPKDEFRYGRLGWFSCGAALRYLRKDNPFYTSRAGVFFGFAVDVLCVASMFSTAAIARNGEAKLWPLVGIAAGLGGHVICKLAMDIMTSYPIRISTYVHNTRYKYPNNLTY